MGIIQSNSCPAQDNPENPTLCLSALSECSLISVRLGALTIAPGSHKFARIPSLLSQEHPAVLKSRSLQEAKRLRCKGKHNTDLKLTHSPPSFS